jgi:hypothetical protein
MSGRQTVARLPCSMKTDPIIGPFRKEMRFQPIEKALKFPR